ncbi:NAD(P)-binding protein [Microthyrium microscopicum]|uniref:NAD(P)-binding protein n=1 Tax=Microthyrium microscopicum TaxID=703497 RepID=A0A6A6U6M3_9PEZI|nr:NAD(P)-binding protein [Microthyrium microscopicum]
MTKSILITGATGRQGGSLIKTLLASPESSNFTLIALTRNAQSSTAVKLKEKGVTILQGDLSDVPAIFKSPEITSQKLWGVFSVQNPGIRASATIVERQQGKALIDCAVKAGVQFFIYASVDRGGTQSAHTPTPVAQFSSKHDIEQHLMSHTGAMKYVILRPTTFMENLTPDIKGTTWSSAYKHIMKTKPIHLISTHDIGRVAGTIFLDPEKYANTAISLVGDKLTFAQADAIFKEKTGTNMKVMGIVPFSLVMLGLSELRTMFKWFPANPEGLDVGRCREEWGLMSWGEWVERESGFKMVGD